MTRFPFCMLILMTLTSCRPNPATKPARPSAASAAPAAAADVVAHQLLDAHNAARVQDGLPPLKLNRQLTAAAGKHSQYMASVDRLGHTDIGDVAPWNRIEAEGYNYSAMAEHVAEGNVSVDQVMTAWLDSPGHRGNIMGNYTDFGCGMATSDRGTVYWTIDFGTPGTSRFMGKPSPVRLIPPASSIEYQP